MIKDSFSDYYELLQVSPNADRETIERVFRFLAKRYHPDNGQTGNPDRFKGLSEAYRTLSDPEARAAYDVKYEAARAVQWRIFQEPSSDDDILLYTKRKRDPSTPGVGIFELEKLVGVPEQHLEFHIWYLREKRLIERTDGGKFAITVTGVDEYGRSAAILERHRFLPEKSEASGESSPRN
ncbi:MAG: DnaJ domain-containing protein [Deltaproteobacteria bacterium]